MIHDDPDLTLWDADGLSLPTAAREGYVDADGARIWYASQGQGPAVVLLHGGMGNATNWGKQVPALLAAGYQAIAIDSRGQGHSGRDGRPFSYAQMADDTLLVLDHLGIERAAFIGWSDGACTALILSDKHPERSAGVFFFACNVDASGTKPFVYTEVIGRCLSRHRKDYAAMSATPGDFDTVFDAVGIMQRSQPNYSAADLGGVRVPVWSVLGDSDEFITTEHAKYLADAIPGAELHLLPGLGHFAPVQHPGRFNDVMLSFLAKVSALR